jgi:phosphoribosylformylglycinamidine cyclo-ligase
MNKDSSYAKAGVDIEVGREAEGKIKNLAASTHSENVLKGIGLFSGFFEPDWKDFQSPVLVSSIDGVGTKVKIAEMVGRYDSIGQDLVNHCINDIAVCGALPLFFLDYIAADKLDAMVIHDIVKGMAIACKSANCALVGGETAEMPGVYLPDNFDVAGAIVGMVDKSKIIDGSQIAAGNILIGIASNGIHTNGYSLVRKVLFRDKNYKVEHYLADAKASLGDELLKVHKSYLSLIQKVIGLNTVLGIAHITGGGIIGNTSRLISENLTLDIDWHSWEVPMIFKFIQREGMISDTEMRQVFNLGIGLVLIVSETEVEKIVELCNSCDEEATIIGTVISQK